jgi:hypothetical protein
VGCVLGAAIGFTAAAKFTTGTGILLGIVFGVVTGVLGGISSSRPKNHPFKVTLRFRWDYWQFLECLTVSVTVGLTAGYSDHLGGGVIAGLITAAVAGLVCAVPCIRAFGLAPGITAAVAASIALGLASGLSAGNSHPVWSGLTAGLIFFFSAWVFVGLFQPARVTGAVSPRSLLDDDRIAVMAVATTTGVAFGVIYGFALGPLFAIIAVVALTVTVSLTVSAWGPFTISRIWLALSGVTPLRTMLFFNEAYAGGVLRQAGGSYQFRHTELKEALLAPSLAFTQNSQGRTAFAGWLLAAATRLLPSAEQVRYVEERRAELDAITAAGGGRRTQVAYAIRQLAFAWWLRTELHLQHDTARGK